MHRLAALLFITGGIVGCASNDTIEDGRDDSFTTDGKLDGFQCTPQEAAAILGVANTASLSTLKNDVGLSAKAADNIVAVRKGDDEVANTADDTEFGSLAQLDAVPYIGPTAFQALLQYVHDADLVDSTVPTGGTWSFETVANGTNARGALTPSNKVVTLYNAGGWKVRLANGTEVALPSTATQYTSSVQLATDTAGTVHVFWPATEQVNNRNVTKYQHHAYRNGSWVAHESLASDWLQVAQSPSGKMFAVGVQKGCYNCVDTLSLFTLEANGTSAPETLWNVSSGPDVDLTVAADNMPALVFGYSAGGATYARKGANAWLKVDATTSGGGDSYATTGGANAVVFAADDGLKAYRQSGMTFSRIYHDEFTAFTPALSATADANGTAHACYIHGGNAIHVQIDAAGNDTKQSLGNAETCRLTTDAAGKVHAFLSLGSILNHATLE